MPDKYDPEYYQRRRKYRLKNHLCTRCGKPIKKGLGLRVRSADKKTMIGEITMPDKYSKEYYQYRRKQRIKRRLCVVCSRALGNNEGMTCDKCRQKHRKKRE